MDDLISNIKKLNIDESVINDTVVKLNDEQERVFNEIINYPFDNNFLFISGNAGVGKTVLLRHLCMHYKHNVQQVAFSAIAARNINGRTIHSTFKINFKNEIFGKQIFNFKVLIIDEISMVSDVIFNLIESSLRSYFQKEKLFGGIKVICFGDLYQLEPVCKNNLESPIFFSENWQKNVRFIELKTNMRQKNDDDLIKNLNLLRIGDESCISYFNSFVNSQFAFDDEKNLEVISLVPTKNLAMDKNIRMIKLLSNKNNLPLTKLNINVKTIVSVDKDDFIFPFDQIQNIFCDGIRICKNARVMMTVNTEKYLNGQIGIIEEINKDYIVINLDNIKQKIFPIKLNFYPQIYKKNVILQIEGYPIIYAWACTIHKMQGITLNNLYLESVNMFANGQLYVALSRVKNSKGLVLKEKIKSTSSILVNQHVHKEYNRLNNVKLF